jgi:hypothetical protein
MEFFRIYICVLIHALLRSQNCPFWLQLRLQPIIVNITFYLLRNYTVYIFEQLLFYLHNALMIVIELRYGIHVSDLKPKLVDNSGSSQKVRLLVGAAPQHRIICTVLVNLSCFY